MADKTKLSLKRRMIAHLEADPKLFAKHLSVYYDLCRRGSGDLPDHFKALAAEWGLK